MNISEIGENGLLDYIKRDAVIKSKEIIKGIGDDAAVLAYDKKKYMLLTTDALIENVHFKRKWFSFRQIGSKAVEQNVSDIAAMGGYPRYCLVSLQLPKDLDFSFFKELYGGIKRQSKKYGIKIIGGNTSSASKISISLTMIGFVEKNRVCLRSNAKKEDLICVSGNLGKSAAGLELLKQNKGGKSISYFLNPTAKLQEARILSRSGVRTMEDISDGLGSEIRTICSESGKGAIIYKDEIPINKETITDAKKTKKDPYAWALYGGEEFELVFCAPKNIVQKLKSEKIKFSIIGKIVDKKKGIFLIEDGKKMRFKSGFEHFLSS